MKIFYLLFFVGLKFITFSQDNISIFFDEKQKLYRGHDNIIRLKSTKYSINNLKIECENCDSLYQIADTEGVYIVRPNLEKEVTIKILKGKNNKLIEKATFGVINLPTPSLFLGSLPSGCISGTMFKILFANYFPEFQIKENFEITDWEINIEDKIFKGEGNLLSEEVLLTVQNITKNTDIRIKAHYKNNLGTFGTTFGTYRILQNNVLH